MLNYTRKFAVICAYGWLLTFTQSSTSQESTDVHSLSVRSKAKLKTKQNKISFAFNTFKLQRQVCRRIRKRGLSSHAHLGTPPGWSLCSLLRPCYSHALGPKRNIGRELYFFTSDINGRNSQAPRLLEVRKVIALRGGM